MHTAYRTDSVIGDRMTMDREFNEQATNSRSNSQEWGPIMTVAEFEVESADDPEAARTITDTEKAPQIIPEPDNIHNQIGAMGGGGDDSSSGNGVIDPIKDALGMGSGGKKGEQEKLEVVKRLTQEYTDTFQNHLEKKGKWNQVRVNYLE